MQTHRKMVERLLSQAGVGINGTNPCDIQVHDERFFTRTLKDKSLGLGESYKRMWEYCLLAYAGVFRARSIQVWQIVMTKVGTPGQPWCRFA